MVKLTPPELKTIGQRIKWLREVRGMNQAELARAIGIRAQSLGAIELGKSKSPAAATLLKLAAALEANPDWIINGRGHHELSSVPGSSTSEFLAIFDKLRPDQQSVLLAVAKSLI